MGLFILAAFIVVPVTEIAVFIEVGGWLGLWPTLGLVVLTAIVGTALLRMQGLNTLMRAQQNLDQGHFPLAEVFDGLCLLFAGALLLTPGFVTDAVGMLFFVPAFRLVLRGALWRHLVATGRVDVGDGGPDRHQAGPTVIDADYEVLDPDRDDDRRQP